MASIVKVRKGDFLFLQGDAANAMFIVKSGEFGVYVSDYMVERLISVAKAGNLFGEMSLFDQQSRSASAKAHVDSEVVVLPYQKLQEDLRQMPEWVLVTLKTMTNKIRQSNNKFLNENKK